MTPFQSYRFGPAAKIVVHSSREQSIAAGVCRNRKVKKESARHRPEALEFRGILAVVREFG